MSTLVDSEKLPSNQRPTRALRVRAEQIAAVYSNSPTTTIGSLTAGASLVVMLWSVIDHRLLLGWFVALVLHQGFRVYDFIAWRRAKPAAEQMERWGRRYWLATLSAGFIWGAASWFLVVPGSPPHQTVLAMFMIAIAGVSIGGLSAFWKGFITLILLMLLPLLIRLLVEGSTTSNWLAAVVAIALGVALAFGRTLHKVIVESFDKRFENVDLVEELSRQKAISEQARAQAEAANRAKTQFFAAASHDLRQPLHALGLFASALSDKIKEPDVLNVVHSINSSVGALEGLFNELLDISKIDAGAIQAVPQPVSLGKLFNRLRLDFDAEAYDKGLRLSIRPNDFWVRSDPVLLERIVRNLLTNALRYTRRGGVLVAARRRGGTVSIEVWDSGIGIPAEQQEQIFDEFVQLANPERSSKKGLGLGLSIVRRLCSLLGHPLELRSVVGRGTVFRLNAAGDVAPPVEQMNRRAAERAPGSLDGIVIAVIDDEEAIVEGMRVLLTGWGAHVVGGPAGDVVLEKLAADKLTPALAIVDFRLQNDLTGLDVIAQLRARFGNELPAVLVTGSTAPEHIEEAKQHDLHLLLKPVMPAKLRTLINFKLQQRLSMPRID
jgi:signal transduction histidine kinase/CheY-like chemotaxis protein